MPTPLGPVRCLPSDLAERSATVASVSDDEPRGKFLYDTVSARLSAQSTDLSTAQGRAKDLIGLAAITTTITGVLANDKLFKIDAAAERPKPFAALLVAGIALAIIPGLYVLWPRAWYLAPDPVDINAKIDQHPTWHVDDYYASLAMGFMTAQHGKNNDTALRFNERRILRLRVAVIAQLFGIAGLALAGVVLALKK
jgi:hypothetical protein